MIYPPWDPTTGVIRNDAYTTGTTLSVYFAELTGTNTGGSTITSYCLEMDSTGAGSGPFSEIGGCTVDSLTTSYNITGLTSGNTYYLRYYAKNSQGSSTNPSTVTSLLLSTVPSQISSATTANSGDSVVVTWTAPSSNGGTGVTLISYKI